MRVCVLTRLLYFDDGTEQQLQPMLYRNFDDARADMKELINLDIESGGSRVGSGVVPTFEQVNFPDDTYMVYEIFSDLFVY